MVTVFRAMTSDTKYRPFSLLKTQRNYRRELCKTSLTADLLWEKPDVVFQHDRTIGR
jgi:hypothetical protein